MIRSFYFFFNAALSIIYSFLPVYLKSLGYSGTEVANIMVIDSVIGLLGISILWGWISDHTQKPALMLKILAFGVAISFFPILTGQYYLILLGYIIFGLFSNPIGGLADSLAIKTAEAKGIDFGKIRVWGSIGWLGATLAVGFILAAKATNISVHSFSDLIEIFKFMFAGKDINWNNPVVIMLIIGGFGMTFVSALGFKKQKIEKKSDAEKPKLSDIKLILKNSYFLVFLLVVIVHIICLRSYYFSFGIHVQSLKLSPTILSIAFSVGTLAEILAFTFFGKLRKYFSLEVIIAVALALSLARWILVANTSSPMFIIGLQVFHAASSGLFIAAAVSLVAEAAESKLLVTYQQVYNYTMAIGNLIGTYVAGMVFDHYKSAVPVFYTLSVFEALGIVFILCAMWNKKKRKANLNEMAAV
jgi:MFS transporter, PPP family, 3-phenylpropionic acid transporter